MRKTGCLYVVSGAVALLFTARFAMASTVVLTFDQFGVIPSDVGSEPILNFYNAGFAGNGTPSCGYTVCGPGPNYGITFEGNALAITSVVQSGGGNFTNEPSSPNVMFFMTGTGDAMNVASGITTGFSFFYSGNSAVGTSRSTSTRG